MQYFDYRTGKLMTNQDQKGFAHILLLLLLIIILAAIGYFIYSKFGSNLPKLPGVSQQPTVSVKTEYQNPFSKDTQYVNPFDQYKSPLVNLKK